MTSVLLQPVGPGDEDVLAEIYASTRAEEMAATGWPPHEVDAFLRLQFEAQRADYTRRFPDSDHTLVLVDGEVAGRIWVNRGPEEIRLLDVSLLPAYRDRGIGTRLLTGLQAEARSAGRVLRHSVLKVNGRALAFYRRLGFSVIGGVESHHLMEWLAPEPGRR